MNARIRTDNANNATHTTQRPTQTLTRAAMIDAVARVIARRGPSGVRWSAIAREAGTSNVAHAWRWFPDLPALVDECYSRSAQGLEESLLRAETTAGNAIDKLAAALAKQAGWKGAIYYRLQCHTPLGGTVGSKPICVQAVTTVATRLP